MVNSVRLSLVMSLALAALFVAAAVVSLDFPRLARYLPLFACAVGLVGAVGEGVRAGAGMWRSPDRTTEVPPQEIRGLRPRAYRMVAWLAGYVTGIWTVGFIASSTLFIFAFLWTEASLRRSRVAVLTVGVMGALYGLGLLVGLRWP